MATAASTVPAWPPALTAEQRAHLEVLSLDYALAHGLVYRPLLAPGASSPPGASAISAPVSLFPTPFPRALHEQALRLQPLYNELYARITMDEQWLETVAKTCFWDETGGDSFMRDLWTNWSEVRRLGVKQPLQLLISRSDYLLHQSDGPLAIKQVEFNTISSSFGSLSEKVSGLHRYIAAQTGYLGVSPLLTSDNLPVNSPIRGLARGLAEAHKARALPGSAILIVVQDGERNAFDQRWLEYELLEQHGVSSHRSSLKTLASAASQSRSSDLIFTPPYSSESVPISVVYYRAAYTPDDYHSPADWQTRTRLESSTAIMCPGYSLQLAGSKKVQQVLATPGVLEYFLPTASSTARRSKRSPAACRGKVFADAEIAELRESFMGLWPLGDGTSLSDEGERLVRDSGGGDGYVLKPQREGGGNNVYNKDIGPFLAELEESDRKLTPGQPPAKSAYILMSLITPPPSSNVLLRSLPPGPASAPSYSSELKETISELGVYGTALFGAGEVRWNDDAGSVGTLLRTKGKESDEGGVAVGFSVLDSVVLV